MKKKTIDLRIIITSIICITALEIIALLKGINGTILTIVVAILAAAIGVAIPTPEIK